MFEIFNNPLRHNIGTSHVTGWNQSKALISAELNKLFTYYRNNITFLPNNHLLVKLMMSTTFPNTGEMQIVADQLSNIYQNMATQLGIGSPYGKPDFSMNSWFFNKRTYEILMLDNSDFDADKTYNEWKNAKPIKVLHHPFNDFSFSVPNGRYDGGNKVGYAVILINPSMMAIQLKGYLDGLGEGANLTNLTIPSFLFAYPVLNMMDDLVDITIRNRLISLYTGQPLEPFKRTHVLGLNNLTSTIDNTLKGLLDQLRNKAMKFDEVLETIPAFSKPTQRDTTPFPINAMTKNTSWIYDIARAPLLDFLVRYNNDRPNYQNLQMLNLVKRNIQQIEMDKSIPFNASPVVYTHLDSLKNATSNLLL